MAYPKILVVDDDPMTCHLMETFLQMENFQTSSATSIQDGGLIPILEKEQPDVLVLDVHLVSYETLEEVKRIRANERWRALPIIMTSAIDYSRKCQEVGANDFILKPFDWQDVTHRINSMLGNSVFQEA
jgi:DNA-binding response OmpR family regulator